jgi:hypothetical protein
MVTVVLLADRLAEDSRSGLLAELRRKFSGLRQKESLVVLGVRGSFVTPFAPTRHFAALERQLLEFFNEPPVEDLAEVRAARLYDLLLDLIPEFSGRWGEIVWAGMLPELEGERARRYLRARLARQLGLHRARLSLWPAQDAAWLPDTPPPEPNAKPYELEWRPAAAESGYAFRHVEVDGNQLEYLALAEGFAAPSISSVVRLEEAIAAATAPGAGAVQLGGLRAALSANPGDAGALNAGASLAERLQDHSTAAFFLSGLLRTSPADPALLRRYALAMAASAPPAIAEGALRAALRYLPSDAELLERLGRARLAQKAAPEAYELFRQSLANQPENTTLWWIAADLARELSLRPGEREALREALRREPDRVDRRARFVGLALEDGDGTEARDALNAVRTGIPAETALLAEFAGYWERLGEASEALLLWRRAIEADRLFEPAYLAATRLTAQLSQPEESLALALRGLEALPDSAGLHAAHASALQALGRTTEARHALRAASSRLENVPLARQAAELENLYGGASSLAAWQRLFELAAGLPQQEQKLVRERAVTAALRDGFASEAAGWLGLSGAGPAASATSAVALPGGVAALSYLSGIPGPSDPSRYLLHFARAVAQKAATEGDDRWRATVSQILEHYSRLAELRRFSQAAAQSSEIVLQLGSRQDQQRTRTILELLGYRLRTSGGNLRVDPDTRKKRSQRQTLAAAIDLDEAGMEEALEKRQNFVFRIEDDFAEILLGEKAWAELTARYPNPLGFAGMLMLDPNVARLYAGLAAAGARTAAVLAESVGLSRLARQYADLFLLYGPVLALDSRNVLHAPGGAEAEAAWTQLAGVSPKQGAAFLTVLLTKDNGLLLAFFSSMHGTSAARQRWFLRTPQRAQAFYELVRRAPEWRQGGRVQVRKSPILELFRELPLDASGEVQFPGGPQIWQVARGAGDLSRTSKLSQRAERARPAEAESLLVRLAQQRYEASNFRFSQLENLLAVARFESALGRELTPREALILSQQFARYEWALPFLSALPGLGERELEAFFTLAENWPDLNPAEQNLALGLFQIPIQLLSLLSRAGAIQPQDTAPLFLAFCNSTRTAASREVRAAAVMALLEGVEERLASHGQKKLTSALLDSLAGPAGSALGKRRRAEFQAVLEAQRIPSLDEVLHLLRAARAAAKDPDSARRASAEIDKGLTSLPVVDLPKGMKALARHRDLFALWQTRKLNELNRELLTRASRKKPNPKDLSRLAGALTAELAPWLELSLRGLIAGFYLRPDDLPVAEDPLLARKILYTGHSELEELLFPPPEFRSASEGAGSFCSGSLAGIAASAGSIAAAGRRVAHGAANAFEERQLGALRNALWWRVGASHLRAVHLSVLAGREWVVDASFHESQRELIEPALEGILSPERLSRVRTLLAALASRNAKPPESAWGRERFVSAWEEIWEQFSVSDLYWLGRARSHAPDSSPVWRALQQLPGSAHDGPAAEFGPLLLEHARSSVPRLEHRPPYEDYSNRLMPVSLAERLSELPLALACAIDEAGLPADSAGLLAEPLARRLFESLSVSDLSDFRSVLALWRRVDGPLIQELYREEAAKWTTDTRAANF